MIKKQNALEHNNKEHEGLHAVPYDVLVRSLRIAHAEIDRLERDIAAAQANDEAKQDSLLSRVAKSLVHGLMARIGAAPAGLLLVIAERIDHSGETSAEISNDELESRTGASNPTMIAHRKKAIQEGVLRYIPRERQGPGTYEITL